MLEWARSYRRADLVPDVVAGITGATILGADCYVASDEDAVAHLEDHPEP